MNLKKAIHFRYNFYKDFTQYELNKIWRKLSRKNPTILSIDDTINIILTNGSSVSRFGEGEIRLMNNESIEFQTFNEELSLKLETVIYDDTDNFLVCLPDVFSGLKIYTTSSRYFWRKHVNKYKQIWFHILNTRKTYYNALITRPYINYWDKSNSRLKFERIKELWNKKDILIIEGAKSRMGGGNDLFNGAKSIKRIICPSINAFSAYEKILFSIISVPKPDIVLIALGPTATVLAYDLHKLGYQAVDIGHIDIEYEWFLMGAFTKVKIPTKFTNEADDGHLPTEIFDELYESQILIKIF